MAIGQSAGRGRKSPVRSSALKRATIRERNLIDPPIHDDEHDKPEFTFMSLLHDAWPTLALVFVVAMIAGSTTALALH